MADSEAPPPLGPPPQLLASTMPVGRAGLMCANPRCWFLVHEKEIFGGYCCKKCHWRHACSSKSKKHHGAQCMQCEAPEGAPRAPAVPPAEPLKNAGGDDDAAPEVPANQNDGHSLAATPVTPIATASQQPAWPGPEVGQWVYTAGFVEYHNFNGLRALIKEETVDGRFHLELVDGTRLRWVKATNLSNSLLPDPPEQSPLMQLQRQHHQMALQQQQHMQFRQQQQQQQQQQALPGFEPPGLATPSSLAPVLVPPSGPAQQPCAPTAWL
mmetsp:Transcript_62924/g.121233  ORF Transcript_62924/g.121233 Transcript_62924/m.121233 type:complete len:269 (+) Transcript_62924:48-854(+)